MLRNGITERDSFKNVRHYITAGEKLPRSLYDQWLDATSRPLLEGIGATETCFLFLANRPDIVRPGTCGMPTPGTEVKLVDNEGGLITKPNTPGVLWVRMDCLATTYWKMEKKLNQKL